MSVADRSPPRAKTSPCEVDQLQDPVDERVAERDERVDRAVRQTDDGDLEEVGRLLDQVDEQPEPDEHEEREAEDARELRATPPGEDLVQALRSRSTPSGPLTPSLIAHPRTGRGRATALPASEGVAFGSDDYPPP